MHDRSWKRLPVVPTAGEASFKTVNGKEACTTSADTELVRGNCSPFQNRKRYGSMHDLTNKQKRPAITSSLSFKTVNGMEACTTGDIVVGVVTPQKSTLGKENSERRFSIAFS